MPIDYSRYPANWRDIRAAILQRAANTCEWCGAENHEPHPVTGARVVLTVAHINHDIENNAPGNLAALCQRCHLRHDAKLHARHAAETRRRKRVLAGQGELWSEMQLKGDERCN